MAEVYTEGVWLNLRGSLCEEGNGLLRGDRDVDVTSMTNEKTETARYCVQGVGTMPRGLEALQIQPASRSNSDHCRLPFIFAGRRQAHGTPLPHPHDTPAKHKLSSGACDYGKV